MNRIKRCWALALSFLKIGLFTFGGGYAMIALIEGEFVDRRKWIDREEFLNVVAIAESTPGPIAINDHLQRCFLHFLQHSDSCRNNQIGDTDPDTTECVIHITQR